MLTEQDIRLYADRTLKRYKEHDSQHEGYINEINTLIRENTNESRTKLKNMFAKNGVLSPYLSEYDDIAYMSIIIRIYIIDEKEKENLTILDHGTTIQELIDYYLKIKFQLWRLEFDYNDNSDAEFLEFINTYKTTVHAVIYTITCSNADKKGVLIKVSHIFAKNNKLIYAYKLLLHGISIYPDCEELLCMMTELCVKSNRMDMAIHYFKIIRYPGSLAREVKEKYGL